MRINYDNVIWRAGQIENLGGDLKKIADELQGMMNEIPGFWRGEASSAYLLVCQELRQNILDSSQSVNDVSREIRSVANRIRDEDERIAREIQARKKI